MGCGLVWWCGVLGCGWCGRDGGFNVKEVRYERARMVLRQG